MAFEEQHSRSIPGLHIHAHAEVQELTPSPTKKFTDDHTHKVNSFEEVVFYKLEPQGQTAGEG